MNRFRVHENVPDPYITHSRDFQLLCNVFDLMNNGVKFDIDTIKSLNETERCPESLIRYLQNKLGFFRSLKITDDTLRTVLKCFPYIIKHKGSKRGVQETICLFLSAIHKNSRTSIEYRTTETSNNPYGNYLVVLRLDDGVPDITLLDELLRYIVPAGYLVEYSAFTSNVVDPTITGVSDRVKITFVDERISSGVKLSGDDTLGIYADNVVSGIGNTTIIEVQDIENGQIVSPDMADIWSDTNTSNKLSIRDGTENE